MSYQDESQYVQKSKLLSVSVGKKKKNPKKMQDQGLSGYSAAPLTSSAPLRDECRLSRVGLGYASVSYTHLTLPTKLSV